MTGRALEEDSLEDLYENAPCGYLSTAHDGTITKVNETFLRMVGYARDQVLGKLLEDLLDPASTLFFHTRFQMVLLLERKVNEVSFTIKHANGTTVPVLLNAIMSPMSDGTAGRARIAIFDATERRRYEHELLEARRQAEASEHRVWVLKEAATVLGAADSLEALTRDASDVFRRAFDATSATLLPVTDDTVPATDGTFSSHTLPLDALLPADAYTRGFASVLTSELADGQPEFATALSEARIESLAVAPLFDGDIICGIMACFFRRRHDFDDHSREVFTTLATYTTQVLRRTQLHDELRHSASHDDLTGLVNRRYLWERLDEALASAARHRRPMAVIYLDLDGFKEINDTLGHAQGDAVLKAVADGLQRTARRSDTVARMGGDEFAIVCYDAQPSVATELAERVHRAVSQSIEATVPAFAVTASIGVAVLGVGVDTPGSETLLRAADAAMYRSKRAGKDRETTVTM